MRTNAALALIVCSAGGRRRHPEDRHGVEPDGARLRRTRGVGARAVPAGRGDRRRSRGTLRAVEAVIEQTIAMLARQTGDATRFAAFRPCYVIAPEEWAGAPTQQGNTVRERLDDPASPLPRCSTTSTPAMSRPSSSPARGPPDDPERRGVLRRRRRRPRARAARRTDPAVHPGTAEVAAVLTGTTPAFSNAKARRVLGWRPPTRWRAELAELADPRPPERTSPAWIRRHPLLPRDAFARRGASTTTCCASTSPAALDHAPGGVFPACGTGEFHALSADEAAAVVRDAP